MTKPSFIEVALSWPVIRRSLIISAIVGTILVVINHGSCVVNEEFCTTCAWQSALTLIVPYCVSTVSCVLTVADQQSNSSDDSE